MPTSSARLIQAKNLLLNVLKDTAGNNATPGSVDAGRSLATIGTPSLSKIRMALKSNEVEARRHLAGGESWRKGFLIGFLNELPNSLGTHLVGAAPLVSRYAERMADRIRNHGIGPLDDDNIFILVLSLLGLGVPLGTYWCHMSGIPLKFLIRARGIDKPRLLYFIFHRMHGFKKVLELHLPKLKKRRLNKEIIEFDYYALSKFVESDYTVKGSMGSNWYFDPHLGRISPRLKWLQDVAHMGGAQIFNLGSDRECVLDATWKSKTRAKAYQEGKYQPRRYLRLWARDDILRWAQGRPDLKTLYEDYLSGSAAP